MSCHPMRMEGQQYNSTCLIPRRSINK